MEGRIQMQALKYQLLRIESGDATCQGKHGTCLQSCDSGLS